MNYVYSVCAKRLSRFIKFSYNRFSQSSKTSLFLPWILQSRISWNRTEKSYAMRNSLVTERDSLIIVSITVLFFCYFRIFFFFSHYFVLSRSRSRSLPLALTLPLVLFSFCFSSGLLLVFLTARSTTLVVFFLLSLSYYSALLQLLIFSLSPFCDLSILHRVSFATSLRFFLLLPNFIFSGFIFCFFFFHLALELPDDTLFLSLFFCARRPFPEVEIVNATFATYVALREFCLQNSNSSVLLYHFTAVKPSPILRRMS